AQRRAHWPRGVEFCSTTGTQAREHGECTEPSLDPHCSAPAHSWRNAHATGPLALKVAHPTPAKSGCESPLRDMACGNACARALVMAVRRGAGASRSVIPKEKW